MDVENILPYYFPICHNRSALRSAIEAHLTRSIDGLTRERLAIHSATIEREHIEKGDAS